MVVRNVASLERNLNLLVREYIATFKRNNRKASHHHRVATPRGAIRLSTRMFVIFEKNLRKRDSKSRMQVVKFFSFIDPLL